MLTPYQRVAVGTTLRTAAISDQESKAIIHDLLKNVYRAFDFREEDDVYDKLAISVSGDLLTDIYLQNRASMLIEQAGGAQAKVKQVEVVSAEVQTPQKSSTAIDVRAQWTALGDVGHWGHIHTRQNVYDAVLTLAVVDRFWKIAAIEIYEEKRVDPYATAVSSQKQ